MEEDVIKRMAKYVILIKGKECTDWSGAKDKDGYPMFWYNGRTGRAARILWECTRGSIPEGLLIRHICDYRSCLNLEHLLLGTSKENTKDALDRGRLLGPVKVSKEMRLEMLRLRRIGFTIADIAWKFDISVRSVYTHLPKGDTD